MMVPPNTFAPAAVRPSSTLVSMGDMREKDGGTERSAVSCSYQLSLSGKATGSIAVLPVIGGQPAIIRSN